MCVCAMVSESVVTFHHSANRCVPRETYKITEGSTLLLPAQMNVPVHRGILVLRVIVENETMQGSSMWFHSATR